MARNAWSRKDAGYVAIISRGIWFAGFLEPTSIYDGRIAQSTLNWHSQLPARHDISVDQFSLMAELVDIHTDFIDFDLLLQPTTLEQLADLQAMHLIILVAAIIFLPFLVCQFVCIHLLYRPMPSNTWNALILPFLCKGAFEIRGQMCTFSDGHFELQLPMLKMN